MLFFFAYLVFLEGVRSPVVYWGNRRWARKFEQHFVLCIARALWGIIMALAWRADRVQGLRGKVGHLTVDAGLLRDYRVGR